MSKQSLQNIPGEADLEPLAPLEQEALEQLDPKAINYEIAVLEESLKQKQPNMAVIKEYLIKVIVREYTLCIPCLYLVYTLFIPCLCLVYTLCVPCLYLVCTLCLPCFYLVFTLCIALVRYLLSMISDPV